MKAITHINTFFCICSFLMTVRAIYLSHVVNFKIRDRSITFFLAMNKRRFEVMLRVGLYVLALLTLLNLTYMVNRILLDYPPYISAWVAVSSITFHACITTLATIGLLMYDQKLFNFRFKRRKNGRSAL